jgi:D-alanine-D-alanine ligase
MSVEPTPRVWVSVDYRPPNHIGRSFKPARNIKAGLTGADVVARLFSVHEGLDSIFDVGGEDCVVFPVEESYPQPDFADDPFGLRKALEARGKLYVGSSYEAVSLANDKEKAKHVLIASGLLAPGGVSLRDVSATGPAVREYLKRYSLPAILKPVSGRPGGSLGVSFVTSEGELLNLCEHRLRLERRPLLIEEYIEGDEVTAWVVGVSTRLRCHRVIEISKGGRPIYDHEAKAGAALSVSGAETPAASVVARLSASELEVAGKAAIRAHVALGAYSYSRVDMIIRDGRAFVLELNTLPGLNPTGGISIAGGDPANYASLLRTFVQHAVMRRGGEGDA